MSNVLNGFVNDLDNVMVSLVDLPYEDQYGVLWPVSKGGTLLDTHFFNTCELNIGNNTLVRAVYITELSKWATYTSVNYDGTVVYPIVDDIVVRDMSHYKKQQRYMQILDTLEQLDVPTYDGTENAIKVGKIFNNVVEWYNNEKIPFEEEDIFRYAPEVHPIKCKRIENADGSVTIFQYWPTNW